MNKALCFIVTCATLGLVKLDPGFALIGHSNKSTGTVITASAFAAGIAGTFVYLATRGKAAVTTMMPASLKSVLDVNQDNRHYANVHALEIAAEKNALAAREADLAAQVIKTEND